MERLDELDPNELPAVTVARRPRVIGAMLGLVLGVVLIRLDPGPGRIGIFFGAWIGAVFLHEAGHLIAGILAGETITGFAVWPLALNRTAAGWRISFGPPGFGGYVRAHCHAEDSRRRRILLISGGPAASLTACCVCFAIARGGGHPLLMCLGGISGALLAFSFASGRPGGPLPDFDQLSTLIENGADARFLMAVDRMISESAMGMRPRDWPDAPGEAPRDVRPAIASAWWMLRYDRAVDCGEFDEAETALVNALRGTRNPRSQSMLRFSACWFVAYIRRDRESAEKWFASVPAAAAKKAGWTRPLARAALALASGDSQAALAAIGVAGKLAGATTAGVRVAIEGALAAMARDAEARAAFAAQR